MKCNSRRGFYRRAITLSLTSFSLVLGLNLIQDKTELEREKSAIPICRENIKEETTKSLLQEKDSGGLNSVQPDFEKQEDTFFYFQPEIEKMYAGLVETSEKESEEVVEPSIEEETSSEISEVTEEVIQEVIEETDADEVSTKWTGSKLTAKSGVNYGPTGKETWYNLPMDLVVQMMHNAGFDGEYWVRKDGVKMFGDYIMVAANLKMFPKGTIVETSLGRAIVCDTGGFAKKNPTQLDIAVNWK